jgi:uronate dehydrogenase
MTRVLVTGSAGAVGRPVCRELARRGHAVRAFDLNTTPGVRDSVRADIVDAKAVRRAIDGVECVIHLAAVPRDMDFEKLVGPNVLGLFNVLDAARAAEVHRVVLASTIQVLSKRPEGSGPARVDEAHPGNHYGLTKLWAEQMGAMYARRFGLSVIAVRIAWMVRNLEEALHMRRIDRPKLYLSAGDVGRFFAQTVEAPDVSFAVLYAASLGGEDIFDMEPARRVIGYQAHDRWPSGLEFELPPEDATETG